MSHRKIFVSALFKTVFHLIFNAKIMSILEITFGISFICNDLDLTDILSKTENALSTAIYQSEVRQLEKNIKFTVRQFASTCLSVKTPQTTKITLNEHQNQLFQLQTTSCPLTHHTKHLSTRYGPAVLIDGWLRMGLLPPPHREFCRHILSCRELKAKSFKRCLHSVLRGVIL